MLTLLISRRGGLIAIAVALVRPTLFHNNQSWEGENPLTSLFQGTGALAILLSGVVCALLLQRR